MVVFVVVVGVVGEEEEYEIGVGFFLMDEWRTAPRAAARRRVVTGISGLVWTM